MWWLRRNTTAMVCFAAVTGKKKRSWLLTLVASDFIHSWTCQTECIQTITDKCVNRPVGCPSRLTPWWSCAVCSLCHPQWFASCLLLLFCQKDTISTCCFRLIIVRGVASINYPDLFNLWDCVIGNSLLIFSGADLLIQLLIFYFGNFLIPSWLKLHVGSNTHKRLQNIQNVHLAVTSFYSMPLR